jgi:hypothetical protein
MALAPKKVHPGGLACLRLRVMVDLSVDTFIHFKLFSVISLANFLRVFRLRDFITEKDLDSIGSVFWLGSSSTPSLDSMVSGEEVGDSWRVSKNPISLLLKILLSSLDVLHGTHLQIPSQKFLDFPSNTVHIQLPHACLQDCSQQT